MFAFKENSSPQILLGLVAVGLGTMFALSLVSSPAPSQSELPRAVGTILNGADDLRCAQTNDEQDLSLAFPQPACGHPTTV
jgi:hypothetical protein